MLISWANCTPGSSLLAPTSGIGYSAVHSAYAQQKAKVTSLTTLMTVHVVVGFQLHHLKPHGKAGTALVGVHSISELRFYSSLTVS